MENDPTSAPMGLARQLRRLAGHAAVYGSADVLGNFVNLLLIPVYTRYLRPDDYGTLALLILFSTVARVLFRMGLDSGFFRLYYDQKTDTERASLVTSVALFAGTAGTLLMLLTWLASGTLARALSDTAPPLAAWVSLSAADVWLGMFTFVPMSLLRVQNRPVAFSAFTAGRHLLNSVLKVVLLVQGYGVLGVLVADVVATVVFAVALQPLLRPYLQPVFSTRQIREVLRFGLPKVPHGLMIQVQNLADRRILEAFVSRGELGLYHVGYSFGTGVKFTTSAFERAWQPFVYSLIGRPELAQTLPSVITWAFGAHVAVGLAVAVLAPEIVQTLTAPAYHAAAAFVPVVTLAYLLHAVFLLLSFGISIEKRTRYYPIVTAASAATNIGGNLVLIPWLGSMGAAWATVLSYAVMAALGAWFSLRLHPLPLQTVRLLRIASAAGVVFGVSTLPTGAPLVVLAAKLGLLAVGFPVLVLGFGFLTEPERAWLRRRLGRD